MSRAEYLAFRRYADKAAAALEPGDKRQRTVLVKHQDGSVFLFKHAYVERRDPYVAVISEHNGAVIFFEWDLDTCRVLGWGARVTRIDIKDPMKRPKKGPARSRSSRARPRALADVARIVDTFEPARVGRRR